LDYHDTIFTFNLAKPGPVVIVLSQLDDRYFRGLEGQYRFELSFRLHKAGQEDYLVRSQPNYRMNRSVNVELDLEAGEYSVLVKVDATRNDGLLRVEEVLRQNAKTRREKMTRIGLAYDLAHSKGKIAETPEEKVRREAHEKRVKERERTEFKKKLLEDRDKDRYVRMKRKLKQTKIKAKEKARAQKRKESRSAQPPPHAWTPHMTEYSIRPRQAVRRQTKNTVQNNTKDEDDINGNSKQSNDGEGKYQTTESKESSLEANTTTDESNKLPPSTTEPLEPSDPAAQLNEEIAQAEPREASEMTNDKAELPESGQTMAAPKCKGPSESDVKTPINIATGMDVASDAKSDATKASLQPKAKLDDSNNSKRIQLEGLSNGDAFQSDPPGSPTHPNRENGIHYYADEDQDRYHWGRPPPDPFPRRRGESEIEDDVTSMSSLSNISDREIDFLMEAKARQHQSMGRVGPPRLPLNDTQDQDEFERDPWNAIVVVGLRIYYKTINIEGDSDIVKLQVVRPNPYSDEDEPQIESQGKNAQKQKGLDIDDSSKDATLEGNPNERKKSIVPEQDD
jgi:hypothetical protein